MPNTIRLRRGSTAPSAGSFQIGEPAWDGANDRLYIKDNAGVMALVGSNASDLTSGTVSDARITGTYTNFTHKFDGSTSNLISTTGTGSPSTLARQVYGLVSWRTTSLQTGAIVIYAPSGLSAVIHQLEIAADAYASSKSTVRLTVNGYRTTGAWSSAYKLSTGSLDLMVRWAVAPDGKNCLILGDVTDTWSNFHLSVVRAHFSGTSITDDTYCTGWSAGVASDLSSFTNITAALTNQSIENLPFRLGGSSTGSIIGDVSPGSSHTTGRTVYNLATYHASNVTLTGAIVFAAPTTTTNIMHWMEIQGYNYTSNSVVNLSIGGYRTTGAWANTSKIDNGNVEVVVRWGVTPGGNNCLILGDVTTVWVHPHISIARALFSYAGVTDAYCAQWTVSVVTDLSAYTQVTAPLTSYPLRLGSSSTRSILVDPSTGSPSTLARVAYNLAYYFQNSGSVTGAIVFAAPTTQSNILHALEIHGTLNNGGSDVVKLLVKGYRNSGAWTTSHFVNNGSVEVPVRWGVTPGGNQCVIIGDTNSVWHTPTFSLARAIFCGSGVTDAYCAQWSASLVTDLSTYTQVTSYLFEPGAGFKRNVAVATTTDVGASMFSAGVLTGYSATVNLNVTTTLSSTTATTTSTAGIKAGAVISGNANIPAATTVVSITNATTFVLSAAATAAGTAVATTFTQTIAALTADGITPGLNARLLLKDQVLPAQNGIYLLTTLGTASVPWVLTRATDANTSANLAGATVVVAQGTVHGGQEWSTDFKSTNTINTTACNWYQVIDTSSANSTAGTIAMNGTQAAGSSDLYARADHVHPTDTSRAPLASPALTGVPTAPTAAAGTNTTQLATCAFVRTEVASSFSSSATAPGSPVEGDEWLDEDTGILYTYVTDASTSQWVELGTGTLGPAGSGITGFTSALSTASPNNTVYAASLSATGGTANIDAILSPKGSGAVCGNLADSSLVGGNKRGTWAVDWQVVRTSAAQVASGSGATIGGGSSNTASGSSSTIAGGSGNSATNTSATVGGGGSNTATGQNSTVSGGSTNTASGQGATVAGGADNTADSLYSFIAGGVEGRARGISGILVTPARSYIAGFTAGCAQTTFLVLASQTTDSTPTVLCSDSSAAGAGNQLVLANNAASYVKGSLIAAVTGGGAAKCWTFEGVIKRGANAAATSTVGSLAVNLIAADSGASTWAIAISADTTNGGLQVQVTGQNSTTIRWVCKLEATELAF